MCPPEKLLICRPFSYPLTLLGNFVYSLANRFHLIPSSGVDVELGGYGQVPGTARAEAERRRCVYLVFPCQICELSISCLIQSHGIESSRSKACQ